MYETIKLFRSLVLPVTSTVILSLFFFHFAPIDHFLSDFIDILFPDESSSEFSLWQAVLSGSILMLLLLSVSFAILFAIKKGLKQMLKFWFIFSVFITLLTLGSLIFSSLFAKFSIKFSTLNIILLILLISFVIISSTLAIFLPRNKNNLLTHSSLVLLSSFVCTFFAQFPSITVFCFIIFLSLYDVYAVLHKSGPLSQMLDHDALIVTANEEESEFPGLIYETETIELGLGDFIVYSLLITKFSKLSLLLSAFAFFGIILGLFITVYFMIKLDKTLPALPISVVIGFIILIVFKSIN
ncbi:hypothetical protein RCL1_006505 [Eukaryota sp. TZLM3-RCL]